MSRYAEQAAYSLSPADAPTDRPADTRGVIIALHGLTGEAAQPLDFFAGFSSPTFAVLAPDLRAHGRTPFDGEPDDFTRAQLADDVLALLEHLGLRPTVVRVVGISLGATVALELTRRSQLPVDRAVFVRPAHGAQRPDHLRLNLTVAQLLRADPETALDRLLERPDYLQVAAVSAKAAAGLRAKITRPGSAERVMRLEHGSDWLAFDADGDDGADTGTDPDLSALVLGAPEDPLHPVAVAQEWHRRLPGSRLELLPPYDPDPEEHVRRTRALVQDFLAAPAPALAQASA